MDWNEVVPILPVAGAVLIWFFNEFSKRRADHHQRKEDRYIALLNSLPGFMADADSGSSMQNREQFLRQMELCWLYCPSSVVRAGYDFLDLVSEGASPSDEERRMILGKFIMSIREDLMGRKLRWGFSSTKLRAADFRILRALQLG